MPSSAANAGGAPVTALSAPRSNVSRGYFYIGSATLLWGISATLGRAAFSGRLFPGRSALGDIDPEILSQCRTTFSFLILAPLLLSARGWKNLRLPTRDFWQTVWIGILGVAASNYFYYLAIQRTNVATAITVQYTAPIWVLVYSAARGLQKPTLQRISSIVLAVLGIALVLQIFGAGRFKIDSLGLVAALLAAIAFAFYNIAGHDILAHYDHWIIIAYTTFSASLFWIVVNPPWKIIAAHYTGRQWLFLLVFALLSMLGPFSLYFAGLKYLEPTRAIIASCLEPVFSILIAAVVLGEMVRPLQVLGIVIVLSAIVVAQWPSGGAVVTIDPME